MTNFDVFLKYLKESDLYQSWRGHAPSPELHDEYATWFADRIREYLINSGVEV